MNVHILSMDYVSIIKNIPSSSLSDLKAKMITSNKSVSVIFFIVYRIRLYGELLVKLRCFYKSS